MEIVEVLPGEIEVNQRFRKDVGDLSDLMDSIKRLGLLHPIGITRDKVLVFGHRRLEAWKRLFPDKPVPCIIVDGDFYLLKLMEFHENKKRKEMTWQEEVLALDELKQIYAKLYGWVKRYERTDLTSPTVSEVMKYSQQKFADELGISRQKVTMDLELAEALKTYPEFWKIETKKAAYHRLLAIRKREQVLSTIGELPQTVQLYNMDFEDAPIADNSVDIILTDPPYENAYVDSGIFDKLGRWAKRVLKPTGLLIFYSGTMRLPEKLWQVNQHLKYFWVETKIMKDTGSIVHIMGHKINQRAKFTWIFYKEQIVTPDTFGKFWIDVYESYEAPEQLLHPWEQEVQYAEYLLEKYAFHGALVCDPMCGSGSFIIAALKRGHPCIGIDIDKNAIELTRKRIATVIKNAEAKMGENS